MALLTANGAEGLWNEVKQLVAEHPKESGYETDLEATHPQRYDLLLNVPDNKDPDIRLAVRLMPEHQVCHLKIYCVVS